MLGIQKSLTKPFLALLSLPATAVGFALSTQIAALSWLLSSKFGLDIHDVALVWLAGPMAGIIGQPIVGAISDNAWFLGGRRKGFIIIGGILGGLMFLALPQIGVISDFFNFEKIIVVATVIALLLDLSINITFNPARSIIADLTPEGEKRTEGFSIMQLISGTFGLLAYFISLALGNMILINIAVVLVFLFSIIPCFFIEEDKDMNIDTSDTPTEKAGFNEILTIIFPLWGYLIFAVYLILDKLFLGGRLESIQVPVMFACLLITAVLGILVITKKDKSNKNLNEFHKILTAHSFSWLGIQSMFVMSFFFTKEVVVPNAETVFANVFTTYFTSAEVEASQSAGNILSLAFLLFNAVGAFFPVLVLEPLCKKLGRVKVYSTSILIMSVAYLGIWLGGHTEFSFYLGIAIAGIGWSAVISIVFAIMSERVDKKKMGLNMGLFNYSVVLPQMMTVGVAALVKDMGDYKVLFLLCGITLFISFIFWLFVEEPNAVLTETPPMGGH